MYFVDSRSECLAVSCPLNFCSCVDLLTWIVIPADGTCSVQLLVLAPFTVAHASYAQIRQAAQGVFDRCAMGGPSRGGVASNIGE